MLMHLKMDGSAGQLCSAVESDDMLRLIARDGDDCVSVFMTEEIANRICTALGQLLTDRHVRKHGTAEQLRTVVADQVERAELLADASGVGCTQADASDMLDSLAQTDTQPPSAADMSEGELILGRRVPSGRLCPGCFCYHEGECG